MVRIKNLKKKKIASKSIRNSKLSKSKKTIIPIVKSADMPATQGMLGLLQKQMKSDYQSLDKKIDSNFAKVISEIHRMSILLEEQNGRNKFVLEGYDQIFKRQDRLDLDVEKRLQNIEDVVNKKVTSIDQ